MVTVRVPATTANLACGFDSLGCALNVYNTLRFTPSDTLGFSGCPEEFCNEGNLAWLGYKAVFEALGKTAPKVTVDIRSEIPVCRGLGSSAALIAAGGMAANELAGAGLSRSEVLSIVTPVEGHPDNLAPAILGGLTASMTAEGRVYSVKYPVAERLQFVVLYPDFTLSTHLSRGALPKTVPFADAVFDLSRLALLPEAFMSGDMELIGRVLDDRLHQPYRKPLVAEFDAVESLARSLGCGAVCLSGAGPSILCVTDDPTLADRLREGLAGLEHRWTALDLRVDAAGARLI